MVALFLRWRCHATITWLEMSGMIAIPIALIAIVWSASTYSATADVEHLNGQVVSKEQDRVSCSHSYQCRCRTVPSGSGKYRSTRRVCDTCYRHSHDYNWNVHTTAGDFTIARVDSQGRYEPDRWSIVKAGDPATFPHTYTNYVKGAPESLFNHALAEGKFKDKLPEYPEFYDYQYSDRVIAAGAKVPNLKEWNHELAMALRTLGASKQANIVIVMTSHDPKFADALRSEWIGGKKNDVVVVIGVNQYPRIEWVKVFSWSKFDIINVATRSDLLASKVLSPQQTIGIIAKSIEKNYVRRPMEEFKYLEDEIEPSMWVMVLALLLGLGASIGLGYVFHRNDIRNC